MALAKEVLAEIHGLLQKPSEWFSIPEIRKRRPQLFATEFVKKGTGDVFSVRHQPDHVRRDLEAFAAGLIERQLRAYEIEVSRVLAENSMVPSPDDDAVIVGILTQYVNAAM